jgi:hypothetical protein
MLAAYFARDESDAEQLAYASLAAAGGALIGHAVTSPAAGSGSRPQSLERSLRDALKSSGVEFVSLSREGRHRAKLLFQLLGVFRVVESTADTTHTWTQADLDDWLYDDILRQLEARIAETRIP